MHARCASIWLHSGLRLARGPIHIYSDARIEMYFGSVVSRQERGNNSAGPTTNPLASRFDTTYLDARISRQLLYYACYWWTNNRSLQITARKWKAPLEYYKYEPPSYLVSPRYDVSVLLSTSWSSYTQLEHDAYCSCLQPTSFEGLRTFNRPQCPLFRREILRYCAGLQYNSRDYTID